MMRSLYSGISGLRNHQTRMDVIGNNIANVNTTGFKASRVTFQELFSQTLGAGMGNDLGDVGGTNPMQVGLGMKLSTVDVMHTRGVFQSTGNPLDLMIDGDGFFIVEGAEGIRFTRTGNFSIDDAGFLVTSNGEFVLNMTPEAGDPGDRRINVGENVGISINERGVIEGFNAGGDRVIINTLGIAMFTNPNGLERVGNSLYRETASSGEMLVNEALAGGRGRISSSGLEMSNVDLSNEFTDMIVTQRGFQANSRIITVSDTMLEELVNLKR